MAVESNTDQARDVQSLVTSIIDCPRCGLAGHSKLKFHPLTRRIRAGLDHPLTHWCPCPVNGQPILLRVPQTDIEVVF